MRTLIAAVAAIGLSLPAAAALGQSDEELAAKVVNNPLPDAFQIYGLTPAPKVRKDKSVQYEQSLRIATSGAGDPWAIGINSPVLQPVKAGDKLLVLVWARLETPPSGGSATRLTAQMQLASAPYTALFGAPIDVGPEWKLHQVAGRADRDYAKGTIAAALHLNTGKHVVDIGPLAVMNLGQ